MEHPFNLKGGGAMVFIGVKIFFFASQAAEFFFTRTCRDIIFFLQKQFLRHKVLHCNRIFFSAHFRPRKLFLSKLKLADRNFFLQKNIAPLPLQVKWMLPKSYKLECPLMLTKCTVHIISWKNKYKLLQYYF